MRRYVRRGGNGIALIDNADSGRPRLRYVFDVADTGGDERSLYTNLWRYSTEQLPEVSQALAERFGVAAETEEAGLVSQIREIISAQAKNTWENSSLDILRMF